MVRETRRERGTMLHGGVAWHGWHGHVLVKVVEAEGTSKTWL